MRSLREAERDLLAELASIDGAEVSLDLSNTFGTSVKVGNIPFIDSNSGFVSERFGAFII